MQIDPKDVKTIVEDLFSSMLGLEVRDEGGGGAPSGEPQRMVTSVEIRGDGSWRISLEATQAASLLFASRFWGRPADSLEREEVADALGELGNIIGGNLKPLFQASSRLSMPQTGPALQASPQEAPLLCVQFAAQGWPFWISVHGSRPRAELAPA